jgi:endonuclease/exonuclease/phosphatase family metal-dependent hydrolase
VPVDAEDDMGGHRVTAMSLNLWNTQRLEARTPPLRALLARSPDLLCVQELRPELVTIVDEALPGHRRVLDSEPRGWTHEGTIWWDSDRFELLEAGAEPFGAVERTRRLWWVRLRHHGARQDLVVATVHLTWLGGSDEPLTGVNPRLAQTRAVVAALDAHLAPQEPVLLMGDLNDAVVPTRVLREHGYADAWESLGVVPPATFPAFPLNGEGSRRAPHLPPSTLDWQFHRGPIRPLMTEVVDQPWRGIAPSDHRPVMTLYALGG